MEVSLATLPIHFSKRCVKSRKKKHLKQQLEAGSLQQLILKSARSSHHQYSKMNQKDDSRTWTCTLGHWLDMRGSTAGHADPCAAFSQYHVPSCYCLKKPGLKYILHTKLLICFLPNLIISPPALKHTPAWFARCYTQGKYMQFPYLCLFLFFEEGGNFLRLSTNCVIRP